MIRVCFVSEDQGLAEVVARTLGSAFALRTTREFDLAQLSDFREWCDVMLLDLRSVSTDGNYEPGIRLMEGMNQVKAHAPFIVLCDSENQPLLLRAMELG